MKPGPEQLMAFVRSRTGPETEAGCWPWMGSVCRRTGYGQGSPGGLKPGTFAHRISYEAYRGLIPAGLHIDHLCRNRLCVNPAHLEPVTIKVNVLRGVGLTAVNAAKTHCHRGHEFTPDNTRWRPRKDGSSVRACRICGRESEARANLRRAEADHEVMRRRRARLKGYGR